MNIKDFPFLVLLVFCTPALANEAQKLLMQFPPNKQAYALAHMVETSDQRCPSASRAFYRGSDKKGNAFWGVQCANGSKYQVMIHNDAQGSTSVLDCAVYKAVTKDDCFTKMRR